MAKAIEDTIRNFGMANMLAETNLSDVERRFSVDLGRGISDGDKDDAYYPQFDEKIRRQAAKMAEHYELFYCLEQSIRSLITQRLAEQGSDWWDKRIPDEIKNEAAKRHDDEVNKGITPRSENLLDYTNFGELSIIIGKNWDDTFNDIFSSRDAVRNVLSMLNTLRGPIAHCSLLAEDEVTRLHLSLRAWFRLME
jgi:hypothetical protein